jgi:hypothetical protein
MSHVHEPWKKGTFKQPLSVYFSHQQLRALGSDSARLLPTHILCSIRPGDMGFMLFSSVLIFHDAMRLSIL